MTWSDCPQCHIGVVPVRRKVCETCSRRTAPPRNDKIRLLAAWYLLALADQPTRGERLPIGYDAELRGLMRSAGHSSYRFKRRKVELPAHRNPRVRQGGYQLAS